MHSESNGEQTTVTSLSGVRFSGPETPRERLRVTSSDCGLGACGLSVDVISEVTGAAIMLVHMETYHHYYPL